MKLLAENQTLTDTFTNIGPAIGIEESGDAVIQFSFLTAALEIDINDSKGFQIKCLAVDTEDGTEFEFPLRSVKKDKVLIRSEVQEFDLDIDVNQLFGFTMDNTIDAIQLLVRVDTVGATAGEVLSLRYNLGYRQ